MPAYSFKERFVPLVLDGSKPHTIRSRRRNYGKIGGRAVLYFGMRTKHCRKLAEKTIVDARSLVITHRAIYIYERLLDDVELDKAKVDPTNKDLPKFNKLGYLSLNQLAYKDGFRPDGTTLESPVGAFELMLRFWKQTHDLPFAGDIICWNGNLNYA